MIISIDQYEKIKNSFPGPITIRKQVFVCAGYKKRSDFIEIIISEDFKNKHFYDATHAMVDYETDTDEFQIYFKAKNEGLKIRPYKFSGKEYYAIRFKLLPVIKELETNPFNVEKYEIGEPENLTFRI